MYNVKSIMQEANAIAKAASQTFGGKPSEYIKEALKQAWAEAKQALQVPFKRPEMASKRTVVDWSCVGMILFMVMVLAVLGAPVLVFLSQVSTVLFISVSAYMAKEVYSLLKSALTQLRKAIYS